MRAQKKVHSGGDNPGGTVTNGGTGVLSGELGEVHRNGEVPVKRRGPSDVVGRGEERDTPPTS